MRYRWFVRILSICLCGGLLGSVGAQDFNTFRTPHERMLEYADRFFIVHYDVCRGHACWTTIPAIMGAQVHFEAKISIYEVINGKKVLLAGPFG